MVSRLTFSRKLAAGFAVVVLLAVAVAVIAVAALGEVVAQKDRVIEVAAQHRVAAERMHGKSLEKANEARAYLMTKDARHLEALRAARAEFHAILDQLLREEDTEDGRRIL